MTAIVVATFYKFTSLTSIPQFVSEVEERCAEQGVRGTILVANEGINGTIAGTRVGIDDVLGYLRSQPSLHDLEHKESYTDAIPFARMKVRQKNEIVTLKHAVDPTQIVGEYIPPKEWNSLIQSPDVIVIDTRNDFEVEAGSFIGSINPKTEAFSDFPTYVQENLNPQQHKRVAMFCTGGIRCEKATAYMLEQGFEEVYHLQGGILKYLEEVPQTESTWQGDCFVFDDRILLDHDLQPVADTHFCKHCNRIYHNNEPCNCTPLV